MKNNNWVFWLIGIGSVVFMSFVLWQNYLYATNLGKDYQGLFGDMFGASNALFTGLSFVGVIIAILLQRQELQLQRNELELTRKEMEQTRDEFVTQNYTLKLQQFENTFFQMLKMLNDIVKRQKYYERDQFFGGEEVFDIIFKNYYSAKHNYVATKLELDDLEAFYDETRVKSEFKNLSKTEILTIYRESSQLMDKKLIPYFSHINSMLKLLSDSEIKNKEVYSSILKSQLNDSELRFIFFKCVTGDVWNEFSTNIQKFGILNRETLLELVEKQLVEDLKLLQNKTAP
ncbi:putative phage abortive infection protein [Chryseobacterium sp. JV274]|uniref:putative phage abortive infection protein n=1 Tax=Chryseobacterium sp. JV274 TaxID=1932669 RepID=UPI0015C28105|nr:putative phage abortive infection protein [Chryseobacterium sp. JV274]CAD0220328.1 Putative phage abortive infection protein [Chryseobacterium sp. JV274]